MHLEHINKFIIVIFFFTISIISCTPEKKLKTLSFFFDGVQPKENTKVNNDLNKSILKTKNISKVNEIKKEKEILSFHKPYREGKCSVCHDTKSSNTLTLKKQELCFKCHKDTNFTGKYVHGPVAAGKCLACHLPHESENTFLLENNGKKLCFICHNETDIYKIKKHSEYNSCLDCHLPHISDNNYFLKKTNIY